jgi:hypothetical protein
MPSVTSISHASEEATLLKGLPMKIAIFGSRILIYALKDPVSEHTSVTTQIAEHHALVKSLKILFETLWEQVEDYHAFKP